MPEFVIHIGPHKTGSTYLQSALAALVDDLRGRGVLYPTDLGPKGHNLLPERLADPSRHEGLAQQFRGYAESGCTTVMLTAEDLAGRTLPQVTLLRDLIGDHKVRVIFYCRSWAASAASHWNQNVRTGTPVRMEDQLRRHIEHPLRSGPLNYALKLDAWVQVFGQAALHLVSLDSLAAARLNTFAHFATTFLGIVDPRLPAPNRVIRNASIPVIEAEILRALNQLWIARTGARGNTMAQRLLGRRATLDLSVLAEAAERSLATLVFDEADPRLLRLHRKLFNDYGDRLVAPHWPRRFFQPKAQALPFVGPDYLAAPGVGAALDKLYRVLAGAG